MRRSLATLRIILLPAILGASLVALATGCGSITAVSDVSASMDINGLSAAVVPSGQSFTVTWKATGVDACQMTSPVQSGVAASVSMTIDPKHPWYPARGTTEKFTIECSGGSSHTSSTVKMSASVTIQ